MRGFVLSLAIVITAAPACAQQTKRGVAGAARVLEEMASRQIGIEQEVEIARRKAEIELELQRQLRALDRQNASTPATRQEDPEVVRLRARHPQWARILTSTAFHNWLRQQPADVEAECRTSPHASIVGACIDAFFGPAIVSK